MYLLYWCISVKTFTDSHLIEALVMVILNLTNVYKYEAANEDQLARKGLREQLVNNYRYCKQMKIKIHEK